MSNPNIYENINASMQIAQQKKLERNEGVAVTSELYINYSRKELTDMIEYIRLRSIYREQIEVKSRDVAKRARTTFTGFRTKPIEMK